MHNKYLKDFYETMKDTNFDLTNFMNNKDSLRFIRRDNLHNKKNITEYYPSSNIIAYKSGVIDITIMHELFHMASSVVTDREIKSGFFTRDRKTGFFRYVGLTEGYTTILDERYFPNYTKNKKDVIGKSYNLTKYFVSFIENFIGAEKMEKMYSLNQIEELESILSYYNGRKRTTNFLFALDCISFYVDEKNIPDVKTAMHCYDYCKRYIFDLFVRKFQVDYIDNLLSDEEYVNIIDSASTLLKSQLSIGKVLRLSSRKYTEEQIDERINKNMNWVQENIK